MKKNPTKPASTRTRRPSASEAPADTAQLTPGALATAALLGDPDAALPDPPAEPLVQQIALRYIVPSPYQTREFHVPDLEDPDLLDLAASIRSQSVISPIVVRPKGDLYELVVGERRYRASCLQSPDLDRFGPPPLYIPAIVRQLSDAEAAAILVIENLKRKDPHPFEEVKGVATLLDLHHGDHLAVAGVLGQTAHWVACRARIHTNLAPEWKQAFNDPGFSSWTVAHFEEIAKLAPPAQQDLHSQFTSFCFDSEMTVADLRNLISKLTLTLDRAPFDPHDDTLDPAAGACTSCTFNTLATPLLFTTDEPADGDVRKARCLNRKCYLGKCHRHVERTAAKLREETPELLLVVTSDNPPREEMPPAWRVGGDVLFPSQFEKTRKNAKDAVAAMVAAGPGAGTVVYVKKPEKASAGSARPADRPSSTAKSSAPEPAPTERLVQLQAKFFNRRLSAMADLTRDALTNFDGSALSFRALLALVSVFGTARNLSLLWTARNNPWPAFTSILDQKDKAIARRLWSEQILPVLAARIQYNGPDDANRLIGEIPAALALIGHDVDAHYRTVAQQLPEPKSWSQHAAYVPEDLATLTFPRPSASAPVDPDEEPPFDIASNEDLDDEPVEITFGPQHDGRLDQESQPVTSAA